MKNPSRLSFLDRYLTAWIFTAMVVRRRARVARARGGAVSESLRVGTTSIPIAVGLIVMMYPPFTKVRYEDLARGLSQQEGARLSLVHNWVVGPILMFVLACLPARLSGVHGRPDHDRPRTLHRDGHRVERPGEGRYEYAAGLVAFNSAFSGVVLLALRVDLHHGASCPPRPDGRGG